MIMSYTPKLDKTLFEKEASFEASQARVGQLLRQISASTRNKNHQWTRFMIDYASWNGRFADGVSALTALMGEQKDYFKDPTMPSVIADRGNYIASFIFEAARDEFDDHIQKHRDTHRCLAQATVLSVAQFFNIDLHQEEEPIWLQNCNRRVLQGYLGLQHTQAFSEAFIGSKDSLLSAFRGLGYHLGSELLADQEFSILDRHLREHEPELVAHLLKTTQTFAGGTHRSYAWIGVHSGAQGGGGVEQDHFDRAIEGAQLALDLLSVSHRHDCLNQLRAGFRAFERDHRQFFEHVQRELELPALPSN